MWHKKFGKRIDANVALPGCHSDHQTAEQFASHFKVVYYPSVDDSDTVVSNGKTADADKLCTEVSTELNNVGHCLINCTGNGVARNKKKYLQIIAT